MITQCLYVSLKHRYKYYITVINYRKYIEIQLENSIIITLRLIRSNFFCLLHALFEMNKYEKICSLTLYDLMLFDIFKSKFAKYSKYES